MHLSGNKQRRFGFWTNHFLNRFLEQIKFKNQGFAVMETCPWGSCSLRWDHKGASTELYEGSCPCIAALWEFAAKHLAGGLRSQGWTWTWEGKSKDKFKTTRTSALSLITSNQNNLQNAIAATSFLSSKFHSHFLLLTSNLKPYIDSGKYSHRLAKLIQYKSITQSAPWKLGTCAHLFKPHITFK